MLVYIITLRKLVRMEKHNHFIFWIKIAQNKTKRIIKYFLKQIALNISDFYNYIRKHRVNFEMR